MHGQIWEPLRHMQRRREKMQPVGSNGTGATLSLEANGGDATGHPLLFKKIAHLQESEFLFLLTACPVLPFPK